MSFELIFIYNAKSGIANALFDFSHKIVSPSTYACSLCSLTYGDFGIKKQWQYFLNELDGKVTFLYKNQLQSINYKPTKIPCILLKSDDKNIQEIISADELNNFSGLSELIDVLKNRLKPIF